MNKDNIDLTQLRPRKKKAAIVKEAEQAAAIAAKQVLEANDALANVSELLDPDEPHTITVVVEGEEVVVKIMKCKARQIGLVMRFLAQAFRVLGIDNFEEAESIGERLRDPQTALTILCDITDEAIATAAVMTDLDPEKFNDLELDDALALVLAVWTVNQAFFSTRVLPMISGIMARGGLDESKLTKPEKTPKSTRKRTSTPSSALSASA